jgi:hypothetical protein
MEPHNLQQFCQNLLHISTHTVAIGAPSFLFVQNDMLFSADAEVHEKYSGHIVGGEGIAERRDFTRKERVRHALQSYQ